MNSFFIIIILEYEPVYDVASVSDVSFVCVCF